ncbi:MAG TPA: alpha/beta hydrolase, partial [Baekduia sp.]|nr:alpha/beta hydrolase [Baekduia sp.]
PLAKRPVDVFRDEGLRLSDGRRLGYLSVGRPTDRAVFYLHGAIGSPLSPSRELQDLIEDLAIRFVTVYRPGFGSSDALPGRPILGHADDVRQLADALGVERFSVAGVSAGGPYAMATAHELGDRVEGVAAISSIAPSRPPSESAAVPKRLRLPLMALARAPRTCTRVGDLGVQVIRRNPRLLLRSMAAGAPGADRDLLAEPRAGGEAIDSFLAATVRGVGGMVHDYLATIGPWGFDPADLQTDVHLWHGMKDMLVPVEHAVALAASNPRFQITVDPDEGHFFFRRRLPDILRRLTGEDTRPLRTRQRKQAVEREAALSFPATPMELGVGVQPA